MEVDRNVIRAQLTSLKRRGKSQRSSGAFQPADPDIVDDRPNAEQQSVILEPEMKESSPKKVRSVEVTADASARPVRDVTIIKWSCSECANECIPIMRESRCLCGHRMKEHKHNTRNGQFPCSSKSCKCAHFFYLVAEGSWILRCRCKHKHIDHDCGPGAHKCVKCAACSGFDSPWVCNCGHTWASHRQRTVTISEEGLMDESGNPALLEKKQHFYRQDGLDP